MRTNMIDVILWQSLAIFLLVGALAGAVLGLLLIFRPRLMQHVNRIASRWISMRRMSRLMDRSIDIEGWLYQRHRTLGILAVLGAGYMLVYFGLLFDKAAALQHRTGSMPANLLDGLLDAMVFAALVGAVVALVVGLFYWLRPSLLRGVEKQVDQWITVRHASKVLDATHDQVERFVAGHARQVGWLLLLGSIYLFFAVLRWLV